MAEFKWFCQVCHKMKSLNLLQFLWFRLALFWQLILFWIRLIFVLTLDTHSFPVMTLQILKHDFSYIRREQIFPSLRWNWLAYLRLQMLDFLSYLLMSDKNIYFGAVRWTGSIFSIQHLSYASEVNLEFLRLSLDIVTCHTWPHHWKHVGQLSGVKAFCGVCDCSICQFVLLFTDSNWTLGSSFFIITSK